MSAAHSLKLGLPFFPLQSNYVTSLIPDIVISNFKMKISMSMLLLFTDQTSQLHIFLMSHHYEKM